MGGVSDADDAQLQDQRCPYCKIRGRRPPLQSLGAKPLRVVGHDEFNSTHAHKLVCTRAESACPCPNRLPFALNTPNPSAASSSRTPPHHPAIIDVAVGCPQFLGGNGMKSPRNTKLVLLLFLAIATAGYCFWGYLSNKPISPNLLEFSGEVGGCGGFQVYRISAGKKAALVVRINANNIPFDEGELRISLEKTTSIDVAVEVLQFGKELTNEDDYFCTDVQPSFIPIARWIAVSGTVVASRTHSSATETPPIPNATYKVSVRVEGLILQEARSDRQIAIDPVEIHDVWVGWYPG